MCDIFRFIDLLKFETGSELSRDRVQTLAIVNIPVAIAKKRIAPRRPGAAPTINGTRVEHKRHSKLWIKTNIGVRQAWIVAC